MLSEFPTKHASNSSITFVIHTQAFFRPILSAVVVRQLTNNGKRITATKAFI